MSQSDLLEQAKAILKHNDFGASTRPAPRLYPHQWLWDSCFIAIGLRHDDPKRAMTEIESLFRGQWKNGMLPHIIFADDVEYHAGPDMWASKEYEDAPRDVQTSCITQPPMVAEAVLKVAEKLSDEDRTAFYLRIIDKLVAYHTWLYRERDSEKTGIVTLIHAWECGTEDAPYWSKAMEAAAPDEVVQARKNGSFVELDAKRPDLKHAPLEQRPASADFYTLYHTFELIKQARFDLTTIRDDTASPLIRDVFFSAVLSRANDCLRQIASDVGYGLPDDLLAAAERTSDAFRRMAAESNDGQVFSQDYRTGQLLKEASIANLMPLYAGSLRENDVTKIADILTSPAYWPVNGVATVPVDSPYYGELRFWQGPVWINTNWLIVEGLKRNGQAELAKRLVGSTLAMVQGKDSLYEYYSARTGQSAGTGNFSWSAALTIDMIRCKDAE